MYIKLFLRIYFAKTRVLWFFFLTVTQSLFFLKLDFCFQYHSVMWCFCLIPWLFGANKNKTSTSKKHLASWNVKKKRSILWMLKTFYNILFHHDEDNIPIDLWRFVSPNLFTTQTGLTWWSCDVQGILWMLMSASLKLHCLCYT